MNFAVAAVAIALGASLLYKGYRGWSWSQFYGALFAGRAPSTPANSATATVGGQAAKNVKGG